MIYEFTYKVIGDVFQGCVPVFELKSEGKLRKNKVVTVI
jgi:hypothetical protein